MSEEIDVQEVLEPVDAKELRGQVEALQTALVKLQEKRHYIVPAKTKGNTIRFGLIGDTHIGSFYERIDALTEFYQHLAAEKITTCLHAGDIMDGCKMYRGQEFELYAHGYDAQERALADKWPDTKVHTYFITGNHDYSFTKQIGMKVGEKLEKVIPNSTFVGTDSATVELMAGNGQSVRVGLTHPGGGTAYAISYKSQKQAEAIPGGMKPDILGIGHYHKADYLPMFRNIHIFQSGCFQSQTPFMAAKPTPAHVGGWIVEATVGDRENLVSRIRSEFIAFYEPDSG
jgi:predicted phosphodiesterase